MPVCNREFGRSTTGKYVNIKCINAMIANSTRHASFADSVFKSQITEDIAMGLLILGVGIAIVVTHNLLKWRGFAKIIPVS